MKFRKIALLIAVAFIFQSLVFISDLWAQTSATDKTVTAIRVKNNKVISAETIISKLKTKVGDRFSQDVINDDIKRLYGTQYFTNVSVDAEDYEDGVAVNIIIEEKPVIDDIIFKGNKVFRDQKLKAAIKSKPNEMLNLTMLAQDIAEIKNLYLKKGYPTVDVTYEIDMDKEMNKAKINITVDEKVRVKIGRIDIKGNKAIKTGQIRKMLATKPAWLFNQGAFNEDTLEDDLDNIKALYDDIGYLDAEAAPKLDYVDGGQVLNILIDIKEGKLYAVGNISVKGNLVFTEKEIKSNIKMKQGKPFSNKSLRSDVAAIRQYYYRFGYMNVIVDVDRSLNQTTGNIDITYNIDAKEPVYVGKVEVRGNVKTKDVVVRRELRLYPGERFNGDKITRSKERIYNLGFFENVSFDTEPTDKPDVQNLIVNVKEAKTGEFSFGGGYSSIDSLMGFAEITQRNFDIMNFPTFTGGGQSLTIKGEIGMVRSNYNIGWIDPWIFGYPFMFGFDIYSTSHNKSGDLGWIYDETRTGGDAKLGKEFTDHFRGELTYRLELIRISDIIENASQDIKDEGGSKWISSLTLDLTYDRRDNIFNPSNGYIINGSIENAGGIILGDKNFVKGTGLVAYYHTFFEKIVLELKGRAGIETAYGSSEKVPIYERFFAGGANTIRGYKERRIGPRDPGSNEPVGGDAVLLGNAEVTFPIYEKVIKGAVFYDVGNVWKDSGEFIAGGNYKSGAGVGVRVNTPIGPVRLDYGYPLAGNYEDERTGEFYFSMSRGF